MFLMSFFTFLIVFSTLCFGCLFQNEAKYTLKETPEDENYKKVYLCLDFLILSSPTRFATLKFPKGCNEITSFFREFNK